MKMFLITILAILSFCLKAQISCTPTITPGQIFYPNTTSVGSSSVPSYQYLCGPNTILYDTTGNNFLDFNVYVNSSCTLNLKQGTAGAHSIWLKANSTLNILSLQSGANIAYEAGAIINNPLGTVTFTTLCSNIVFPVTNCIVSVNENTLLQNDIKIYPNPFYNKVTLECEEDVVGKIKITNYLGQTIFTLDNPLPKQEIDLSAFTNGIYFLNAQSKTQQRTFKVVKE